MRGVYEQSFYCFVITLLLSHCFKNAPMKNVFILFFISVKLVERSLCHFLTFIVVRGGVPRVSIYDSLILAPESTGFEILPRAAIIGGGPSTWLCSRDRRYCGSDVIGLLGSARRFELLAGVSRPFTSLLPNNADVFPSSPTLLKN